jgi:hypothetical protein
MFSIQATKYLSNKSCQCAWGLRPSYNEPSDQIMGAQNWSVLQTTLEGSHSAAGTDVRHPVRFILPSRPVVPICIYIYHAAQQPVQLPTKATYLSIYPTDSACTQLPKRYFLCKQKFILTRSNRYVSLKCIRAIQFKTHTQFCYVQLFSCYLCKNTTAWGGGGRG